LRDKGLEGLIAASVRAPDRTGFEPAARFPVQYAFSSVRRVRSPAPDKGPNAMPLNLFFVSPGVYTIDDDGILGNNTSVIRDANGTVVYTIVHPVDSITLTVSTPGVHLIINTADSLGAADFTIGDLTNPAACPDSISVRNLRTEGDVVLAATGAITEAGSDAAPDITAATLVLSAGTGVGAGNAIETRVGALEAETTTGGINIANQGAVLVGGLSVDVAGLNVATSGNLSLTATGSIVLNDDTGFESVHGGTSSGNVTLTAIGANADVISVIDQDAISSAGGAITVNAGRDIAFGTTGPNFDNDVRARGAVTFSAGRDIIIDGFADIVSDDFGANTGGAMTATAGRNITIANSMGTDAGFAAGGSAGADVNLTTGAGGVLSVLAANTLAISSNSGDITVRADEMVISATSGMNTDIGRSITLRTVTEGRGIDLGTVGDPGYILALSNVELNRLFNGNLVIGDSATDTITVTAAISRPSGDLRINSGGDLLAHFSVDTAGSLILNAAGNLLVDVGAVMSGGSVTALVDSPNSDAGVGGIVTIGGLLLGSNTVLGGSDSDTMSGGGLAETFRGGGGADMLVGNGGADTLRGEDGNDILNGGVGNDLLDGGVGGDTMTGGQNDDLFHVDNVGDTVNEAIGEGDDRVIASVSYALSAAAEVELLTTANAAGVTAQNLTGSNTANVIIGNAGANRLFGLDGADQLSGLGGADRLYGDAGLDTLGGGDGNDILDGGAGSDTLVGGAGDDLYYVDDPFDVIVEAAAQGNDRVFASVSHALAAAAEIETLTTDDSAAVSAINLTGNGYANTVVGNAGANTLSGLDGNDMLSGLDGADRLYGGTGADQLNGGAGADIVDGGTGVDILTGGLGDDFYYVDSASDVVSETAGQGTDRVFASASYALAADADIETLTTVNSAAVTAINLTGNGLANTIYGNEGANTLRGLSGNDSLLGLGGADRLEGGLGHDSVYGGAGNDVYVFGAGGGIDTLTETSGSDTIEITGALTTSDIAYQVIGADLYVGIRHPGNPGLPASQCADRIRIVGGATEGSGAFVESLTVGGATVMLSSVLPAPQTPFSEGKEAFVGPQVMPTSHEDDFLFKFDDGGPQVQPGLFGGGGWSGFGADDGLFGLLAEHRLFLVDAPHRPMLLDDGLIPAGAFHDPWGW
jgi:Ca2+-binding RTX toxin-like protein